jgi:ABC-type nitrate/sulfonate/bicarbonate transport system permease component
VTALATTVARAGERVLLPLTGLAVALVAFELAPRVGILPRGSFPPVSEVFVRFADLATTEAFRQALWGTLRAWGIAMVIVTVIAVPLGFLIGSSALATLVSRLTIDFLRPIPSVALIPLLVLIYGTRPSLKIALAVFGALWPLLFQAIYGIKDVDPVARDTAKAFGLGPLDRLRRITLPSTAPFVATGMRLSASVALILVVTGEYIVGVHGLGREVFLAQSGGAYDTMYAYIVAAGLVGVGVNLAFAAVEQRVLFWHASQRSSGLVTEAAS